MHRNMHIKHTQHITQIVKKTTVAYYQHPVLKAAFAIQPNFALMKLAFKYSVFDKATSIC